MEEFEGVNVSYPSLQISKNMGEYILVSRGELAASVIQGFIDLETAMSNSPHFHKDTSVVRNSNAPKEKCDVCGSDMFLKTKAKKDGGTYDVYECTNVNCNTNEYNGKMYRTIKWPKK